MAKTCSKCGLSKDESEYYKRTGNKDGTMSWCRDCVLKQRHDDYAGYPEKHRISSIRYYERVKHTAKYKAGTKQRCRISNLRKMYGLTPGQHQAMYLAQNGCCAVCGESLPYDKVQTDHDHNTGKVRGLLCKRCNTQIAIFDDYELWDKALEYIERTR